MYNKPMNIYEIFCNGTILYFKNCISLTEGLLFSVFGQLFGIILILAPVYFYSQNIKSLIETNSALNNISLIFLILLLITLPGFFIFTKACWDYLIQTVSINLMVEDITNYKEPKANKLYSQIVRLRNHDFVTLLLFLSLIWIIGMLVPSIIFLFDIQTAIKSFLFVGFEFVAFFILSILTVYLSLCFQVFAFESSLDALQTMKNSFCIVINNFWRTLILGIALFIVTAFIVPGVFQILLKDNFITTFLAQPVKIYVSSIITDPTVFYNSMGVAQSFITDPANIINEISVSITLSIICTIITALMLPLGTACYALLYMDIIKRKELSLKNKKNKK
jgi:hypothetical protein